MAEGVGQLAEGSTRTNITIVITPPASEQASAKETPAPVLAASVKTAKAPTVRRQLPPAAGQRSG
jgi:hypothetical protein